MRLKKSYLSARGGWRLKPRGEGRNRVLWSDAFLDCENDWWGLAGACVGEVETTGARNGWGGNNRRSWKGDVRDTIFEKEELVSF